MKKTILQLALTFSAFCSQAQLNVADFESFTLAPNSAYQSTVSAAFVTMNASFEHSEGFGFWLGGFTYTNKYDSTTTGFTNLHGVIPYKGYNNSNIYVVGQDRGKISLASAQNTVDGFYITNTTFAYKTILKGDSLFARKFGDTTGTGSGTTIAQGSYPDYFKVTVKGYDNGVMKTDSSVFYLADFRFANNSLDYIVNTWQWMNTSSLGEVDSIQFFMYSTDMDSIWSNTPTFFGMDNFTTKGLIIGLEERAAGNDLQSYPNPFQSVLYLNFKESGSASIRLYDMYGQIILVKEEHEKNSELDLGGLAHGVYFLEVEQNGNKLNKRIIKN